MRLSTVATQSLLACSPNPACLQILAMLWRQGQQELLLDLILGREPGSAPGLCQQVLAVVDAATRDPSGGENTAPGWPLSCFLILADCRLHIEPGRYAFTPPDAFGRH